MIRSLALASVVLGSMSFACGGGAPPAPASARTAASEAPASDAERCLATASQKHERKPNEPTKITAKHILVKWSGAKKAPASVTRTREAACLRAAEARQKLASGESFAAVVATYSEEQGAATREGSLGSIQRTDVVPPFADAAFELGIGEGSDVVETEYGFHVIVRVE